MNLAAPHTTCRVCGAALPAPYLDLGSQPLANALWTPDNIQALKYLPEGRYPLQVALCGDCGLSQLTVVVDPVVLYAGYRFRAGVSDVWRTHCELLAEQCQDVVDGGRALDIAANDGTMLRALQRRGWDVTGVDPSPCDPDPTTAPRIIPEAWSGRIAQGLVREQGRFDLVIAQNVLGHVDDPVVFLEAITKVLAHHGVAVVEVPHVGDMLESVAFDTIYHEHLSYWSLGPLQRAARQAGLTVVRVEHLTTHGGSRRYWLKLAVPKPAIDESVALEQKAEFDAKLWSPDTYETFNAAAAAALRSVRGTLHESGCVVGWGASAKAAVMLNALEHLADVPRDWLPRAIIDECAEKQGYLMPGVHTPIIAPPDDLTDVDVLWVLSWNNAAAIQAKAKARGFRGKFLLTQPTVRLEDAVAEYNHNCTQP